MPAIQVVLIIGAVVLGCGSLGLLAVRLSNPLLRGLGWVGGAFGAGALGALALLMHPRLGLLMSLCIAGTLSLTLFVLLQVSVQELIESKSLVPKWGVLLLSLQGVLNIVMFTGHCNSTLRTIVTGLLVALQAGQTSGILLHHGNRETRVPARFTGTVIGIFSLLTVIRCIATGVGLLSNPAINQNAMVVMFTIYIASALGVGFGLFWMSTTVLTSGLEQMASTDPLTRIYNRRVFLMWCDRELERSQRSDGPFSILMIDLDRFKAINDRYGHATGDEALCAAVEKMQDSVRGIDVLGRWGGEEFSVLLPHASAEAALLVAERVRASIARILLPARETRLDEALETVRVTASVGVATYQGAGDSVQGMVQRADSCLYRAKATGRNRVVAISDATASDKPTPEKLAAELLREPIEVTMQRMSRHPVQ